MQIMDTRYFTEEHEMFRKSVRDFVEKEMTPHADLWEEQQDFPNELFKKMGDLGFLGIRYPEQYGGSELDFFYTVVLCEELARSRAGGVALAVMVQTDMATPPLAIIGNHEQKEKYLAPAIKGDMVAALGITEPDAGSDVAGLRTTAVRDGDDYVINGSKIFITNGVRADFITLAARAGSTAGHQGISLFIVPTDTPGFSVGRKLNKVGHWSSDTAELIFEDVRVPRANMLGDEGRGFYEVMKNFQGERLVGSIFPIAYAQLALDETIEYVRERKQFGRPLAAFQVTQHKIVQMAMELEAARELAYKASWMYDQGMECTKEVSMGKAFATEVAKRVSDECLQLHGGYGYMMEYFVQRAWRDIRMYTIGGGTTEIMKEIIAKQMGF
jgi:alkylation response protein AidB-like acyl-CoA dehydrogenase